MGLYIPCVGRMAVERCVGYFVILACSSDVWETFSSGTSLNKQCLTSNKKKFYKNQEEEGIMKL